MCFPAMCFPRACIMKLLPPLLFDLLLWGGVAQRARGVRWNRVRIFKNCGAKPSVQVLPHIYSFTILSRGDLTTTWANHAISSPSHPGILASCTFPFFASMAGAWYNHGKTHRTAVIRKIHLPCPELLSHRFLPTKKLLDRSSLE